MLRRPLLLGLAKFGALGWAGLMTAACANGEPLVSAGMSKAEVRRRLGPPQRIAVLDGKLLSTVPEDQEDRVSGRLAYFYGDGRGDGETVVWFQDGVVTSVARQPAVEGPDPTPDH